MNNVLQVIFDTARSLAAFIFGVGGSSADGAAVIPQFILYNDALFHFVI
jgi:hypothetical protein